MNRYPVIYIFDKSREDPSFNPTFLCYRYIYQTASVGNMFRTTIEICLFLVGLPGLKISLEDKSIEMFCICYSGFYPVNQIKNNN
jgi:hypothetical protein